MTAAVQRPADALVTLSLSDPQSHQVSTLTCTPEHPVYVHGKGFVPAGAVGVGSQIVTRAGPLLTVKAVSWKRAQGSGGYQVFNVEVQDTHSYFAGNIDGGVWVHNVNCIRENHEIGESAENEWREWLQNEQGVELEPKTSVDANGPDAIRLRGNNLGWDYAELKPGNAAGANGGWQQLLTRPGQGYSGTGALYQYTGTPGNFVFSGPFFQETLF